MEKRFGWYNSITNVRDSPPKFQLLWSVYSKNLNQHILAGCLFFIQTSLSMLKSFSNSFHIRPTISMWNACPSLSFPITLGLIWWVEPPSVFAWWIFNLSNDGMKTGFAMGNECPFFGGICYMSSGLFKKMGGTSNCFCGFHTIKDSHRKPGFCLGGNMFHQETERVSTRQLTCNMVFSQAMFRFRMEWLSVYWYKIPLSEAFTHSNI